VSGCAPATLTRLICEEFAEATIAPEWLRGVTAAGHLTVVDAPVLSKPHAVRSAVDTDPNGADARLFRGFGGPFRHARFTFDVQIESGSGFVSALALGECAFLVGTDGDGLLGQAKNGETREAVTAHAPDPALLPPAVWRRVGIDASDATAVVSIDDVKRLTLTLATSCGMGDVALTVGLYGQTTAAAVYFDNVSLDAE
jgi:hypothetical protein